MKLFTYPQAPSPQRVHLFLAAKGMDIEQEVVDIRAGEHLQPEFARRHPDCTVPALELDDGTILGQSAAICRYLEDIQPDPPLLGATPQQRARIHDRDHWVEMNGLLAVMEGFRNAAAGMKDRALSGQRPVAQIPELAERGRQRFDWFMHDLDAMLSHSRYVAGDEFSVADITALVTVDFGLRALKTGIPDHCKSLKRWHEGMQARF